MENSDEFYNDEGMLECVCAQHEIDHLEGRLITDSEDIHKQLHEEKNMVETKE